MIEKKIEQLGSNFDGIFKLPQDYTGVSIIIPENWHYKSFENAEYLIEPKLISKLENGFVKIMFIGSPKATITNILDYANSEIRNNLENDSKNKLFQLKIEELKKLFDENQLSKLENLVFKFDKKNKKKEVSVNNVCDENLNNKIEKYI